MIDKIDQKVSIGYQLMRLMLSTEQTSLQYQRVLRLTRGGRVVKNCSLRWTSKEIILQWGRMKPLITIVKTR